VAGVKQKNYENTGDRESLYWGWRAILAHAKRIEVEETSRYRPATRKKGLKIGGN